MRDATTVDMWNLCYGTRTRFLVVFATGTMILAVAGGCRMAANGQNVMGVRDLQEGKYQAAMQRFQHALAQDPRNADAYYNTAATFHRLGDSQGNTELLKQAETLYNQCLDIDKDHVECHRGLAVLLVETNRSDRAFNLLRNWALSSPQSAEARVELARLHEEFGQADSAQLHLQQALQVDQHSARAWAALGRLRERAGDYRQALANYQQAFNLNSFQTAVGERIATLNRAVQGGQDIGLGGTRTVNTSVPNLRY